MGADDDVPFVNGTFLGFCTGFMDILSKTAPD